MPGKHPGAGGVWGAITSGCKFASDNYLAGDKTLYKGPRRSPQWRPPVPTSQRKALALIKVDYEELAPVMTVQEAMKEGAPRWCMKRCAPTGWGKRRRNPANVAAYMRFEKGDAEQGFAAASVVVEREFETASVHQGYIEPHNATAFWNSDGQLTIWCSTQGSFVVRTNTADALRHPVFQNQGRANGKSAADSAAR